MELTGLVSVLPPGHGLSVERELDLFGCQCVQGLEIVPGAQ